MTRAELLRSDLSPTTRAALTAPKAPKASQVGKGTRGAPARQSADARAVPTLPDDEAAALGCLIFRLPLPQTLTNSGHGRSRHWRAAHEERQKWMREADRMVHPPVPRLPILHARLAAVLVLGGAMDDDNAMSRCKVALDWLVQRRYLRTDRKRLGGTPALVWEDFPGQDVRRNRDLHCLVLHLTPLPTTP